MKNTFNNKGMKATIKALIISVVLFFSIGLNDVFAASRYAVATGNWNSTATWSATSGGAPGATVPAASDVVFIENGWTVTVTASTTCASLTFSLTNTASSLVVNGGFVLTVTNAVTLNQAVAANTGCTITGAGSITCASVSVGQTPDPTTGTNGVTYTNIITSSITSFNVTGNMNLYAWQGNTGTKLAHPQFLLQSGTLNVDGQIIGTFETTACLATFSMATGAQTGTLLLMGATPFPAPGVAGTFTRTLNGTSATVNYDLAGAQTVFATTYTNITLSGSGNKTFGANTINGKLSLQGTAAAITTAPTFGAASTLEYKGSALQTATAIAFPATNGPTNLIIDNAAGVTFPAAFPRTITGTVTLTNGILTTVTGSELTVNNTSSAAITGASTARYISGPMVWYLATGSTYTFPVGKGGTYYPFDLTSITGTAPVIKVEAFNATTGGTASAPLTSLSTTEYWSASVSSGTFSGGSVSLTRQIAIGTMTAIGRSATQGGAYSNLNGTVSGTSIITSDNTGASLGFFVMAVKTAAPPTILTISNPTTAVTTANVCASALKVPIHAFNIAANGTTGTGALTNFQITTTGTYAVADVTNFKIWYNTTNSLASATLLSTKTPVTTAGVQTFPAFTLNIPAATTYYFWVTMDAAATVVDGRTITVSGSASTDMTTTLTKAGGPTSASGTQTFKVTPATPGVITGTTPVSPSTAGLVYSIAAVTGATSYNWYVPNGWTITAGGTTVSMTTTSGALGQDGNIRVIATNTCGNSDTSFKAVTIVVLPTITLGTNPTVCRGITSANLTYSATTGSPNQYSIVWSGAAPAEGFSNVTLAALPASPIVIAVPGGAAAAVYSADLTVKNSGTGATSVNYPITVTVTAVSTLSATNALTSPVPPYCPGTSLTFTATPTNGGASPSYQWKVNGGNVGLNQNTYTSSTLSNGDLVTCTVTGNKPCASPTSVTTNSVAVTFNTPPQPGAITGPTSVLATTPGYVYSIGAVGGALNYSWTYPAGWTLTAGGGTNTANLTMTLTSGVAGGAVSVTANNACGSSVPRTLSISIALPHDQCANCHLWHNAMGNNLTASNGNSNLCITCHSSGQAAGTKPLADADRAIPNTSGTSHRWNMPATNGTFETNTPTFPEMQLRMLGDSISCSTCHNQHTGQAPAFLRVNNTGDAMCKDCHSARNVGTYAANPANKGSHPVGTLYPSDTTRYKTTPTNPLLATPGGKVECLSCHNMHYAPTTDGNLLHMSNTNSALCVSCHSYKSHMNMDCNKCHKLHNPNKNNILMINDTIDTPNSGKKHVRYQTQTPGAQWSLADGDATYDGACEVCHTQTRYFKNTGGASHNPGTDCKTCHNHKDDFKPNCISCHNTTQGTAPVRPKIVGTGGAFDSLSFHASNKPTPSNNWCSTCHFTADHADGTKTVKLNDFSFSPYIEYTSNVLNLWCFQCHDGTPPAGVTFPGNNPKYNKTNFFGTVHEQVDGKTECMMCHKSHGSSVKNLVANGGVYNTCYSCHKPTGAASTMPIGTKAVPGTSGNWHAWDVAAINPARGAANPTNAGMLAALDANGKITCSTCHDPHDNTIPKFLRVTKSLDTICKDCHASRNKGTYRSDPINNIGSHPVGVVYPLSDTRFNAVGTLPAALILPGGKVECSTCHSVHNSTTNDGYLLNMANTNSLCIACHTYTTHKAYDCQRCHDVHSDVGNTNIYMVRNSILTPNSGTRNAFITDTLANVQGIAPYEGICETCHTNNPSLRHYNWNVPSGDHTHNANKRCSSCHYHSTGFPASAPTSCVVCHNTAQGPRPPIVVAVGAQFMLTSKHTGSAPTDTDCKRCHTPSTDPVHAQGTVKVVDPDAPLTVWTGAMNTFCVKCHDGAPPAGVTFPGGNAKYNKSNFAVTKHQTNGGMGTNSCILCHDGHGSIYSNLLFVGASNYLSCYDCHRTGGLASTMIIDSTKTAIPASNIGNTHAFNVNAINNTYKTVTPTNANMLARMEGTKIVCSTCHDVHDQTNAKLLRMSNASDAMCKDCHSPRNKAKYVTDIVNNRGTHPVGITYPATSAYKAGHTLPLVSLKVECSTCHGVHNTVTNDGKLLRMANDNNLCKDCHNYQPHQGFDCLVCHVAHGGNNNIMLIRDVVNTKTVVFTSEGSDATPAQVALNSFSDGNATRDGICEVCHTTTLYHKGNVDDGVNHNDGKKCVACHSHGDAVTSFPQGSCHGCHQTTAPADPNIYPATGAHAKHCGPQYMYKCSECHWGAGANATNDAIWPGEAGHSNSTVNVIFNPTGLASRGGLDIPLWGAPTWNSGTKTCSNIYCHSNGRSAVRGTDGVTPWSNTRTSQLPTYTNPVWTGTITLCTSCHGGKGNMTSPYTITTSPLSPNAHLILAYDGVQTPNSGLHTHAAMYSDSQDATGPTGGGAVQCWLCHNTTGVANSAANYQGTYGSPLKKHVDGQTYFKHALYADGGTWAPWNGPNGYMAHCISKPTSWP